MFEIVGHAWVFPAIYPNSAKMAVGWPELSFSTCAHGALRKNSFPFSPGANLGGFGLLRNGGKHMFAIMGQAGVFPAS